MKVAAVLPAYNEAERVGDVIRAVRRAPSIDELVVVNDGSTDRTSEVAHSFPGVRVVDLTVNRGKGGAMIAGADATNADILLFLDADLIGLRPEHVETMVRPVKSGKVRMTVGKFVGGRPLTDWAQRISPNISGQRAIRRDEWERIPDLAQTRYGVEIAITKYCVHFRVPRQTVPLAGVSHPMKEQKLGLLKGWASRVRMYYEILKIVLDRRAPKRARPKRAATVPGILRKIAANQRMHGHAGSAPYRLYQRERAWHKRRQDTKSARQ